MTSASQLCGDSRGAKPWVGVTFAHRDFPLDREVFPEVSSLWPTSVAV